MPERVHDDLIDGFGSAIDIDDATVVVGARREDGETGKDSGAVYVYEETAGVIRQMATLRPSVAYPKQEFGACLAIDGTRLLVGTGGGENSLTGRSTDRAEGPSPTPVAFVYEKRGSDWVQVDTIAPEGRSRFDRAGCPVALSGDQLLVGAPADDEVQNNQGAAYLFTRSPDGWRQHSKLIQRDEVTTEEFGSALAVSPHGLFVGAHRDLSRAGTAVGSAYVYPR